MPCNSWHSRLEARPSFWCTIQTGSRHALRRPCWKWTLDWNTSANFPYNQPTTPLCCCWLGTSVSLLKIAHLIPPNRPRHLLVRSAWNRNPLSASCCWGLSWGEASATLTRAKTKTTKMASFILNSVGENFPSSRFVIVSEYWYVLCALPGIDSPVGVTFRLWLVPLSSWCRIFIGRIQG